PDTQAVTDATDQQRLQEHHPQNAAIGNAHRFQRPELLQAFQNEKIKRLARDRGTDNEPQCDRISEVHRNTRRTEKVVDGVPKDLSSGQRDASGLLLDLTAQFWRIHLVAGLDQDEIHQAPFTGHVAGGLTVTRVDNGVGEEWLRDLAYADQNRAAI